MILGSYYDPSGYRKKGGTLSKVKGIRIRTLSPKFSCKGIRFHDAIVRSSPRDQVCLFSVRTFEGTVDSHFYDSSLMQIASKSMSRMSPPL